MSTYKPTIGIEVHAELKTKSKMFCGCVNDPHDSIPNTHTCPVCLAHPGTLPVVNEEAVAHVLTVGRAINGKLADFSEFDRKNYFYPDIPKAYQISQYAYPLVTGGTLAGVAITRIHLEEDTARSQHEGASSLVDFNRAGVPLMELVTEPVIHGAEEAGAFCRELQLLLRMLGVSAANMERGEMRVEANISVSPNEQFGTKVEVKNLNSFRAMEAAISYEIERQSKLLAEGGSVVQETRGWDEGKQKTFTQRVKESADDYRYFPDPDIPKYQVSSLEIPRLHEKLPKLATELRSEYRELGLSDEQIESVLADEELRMILSEVVLEVDRDPARVRLAANYITSDLVPLLVSGKDLHVKAAKTLGKLVTLLAAATINSRTAKDLLHEVVFEGQDPEVLATERGLLQKSSKDDLADMITKIITENASVVAEYRAGKEASLQFLIGQGMKLSRGAANPQLLAEWIKEEIKK